MASSSSIRGFPNNRLHSRVRSPTSRSTSESRRIYLSNREDGSTVELTPVPDGLRPGNSISPIISGDGCSVVTITEMALDVFSDDDGDTRWDVYRSVLPHCEGAVGNWELVSTRNDGSSLARDDVRPEFSPSVSRSGTAIAFVHPDERLFEAPDVNAITLVDLTVPASDSGRAQVVPGMPIDRPNTVFVHVGLDQPALSDDGRYPRIPLRRLLGQSGACVGNGRDRRRPRHSAGICLGPPRTRSVPPGPTGVRAADGRADNRRRW